MAFPVDDKKYYDSFPAQRHGEKPDITNPVFDSLPRIGV